MSDDIPNPGPEKEDQDWVSKIQAREKVFEQGWWKTAEKALCLYNLEKVTGANSLQQNPFNILYSNTEVLAPSLYSASAKPEIRARHKQEGVGLLPLTDLLSRFLTVVADPGIPNEEHLDGAMMENVASALTAGMGFIRLRNYPDKPIPLCFEAGHYKGLIWPQHRKWSKLPWIAFRHELTKDEFFSQFDIPEEKQSMFQPEGGALDANGKKKFDTIVYEVWDKKTRKIIFLCPDWQPLRVSEEEDALKLQNFFPLPGFLSYVHKPGICEPGTLYAYYEEQATELNRVTVRLNKVLTAIKVRGVYHPLLGTDLDSLVNSDDMENGLVSAKESTLLQQGGGFDKLIWMLPIEKLIQTATELYRARESIKQVIYEITGLGDILRGVSVASETATAQDLKNKWGTVRLRKMQTQTAHYVRDLFRLAVDAGVEIVPPEQWKALTRIELPLAQEKQAAQQTLQMAKMGMPVAPQLVQQQQAVAAQPSVEELLQLIRSDVNRTFVINVQTNSTIDADTAQDRAEVGEFMNAMGQLLSGLQPLATMGPSGLNAAKEILLEVARRFKLGLSVVEALSKLAPPPPAEESPGEKAALQAETQKIQLQAQSAQMEHQAKMQQLQLDQQLAAEKHRLAMEEVQQKREQLQIDIALSRLKLQAAQAKVAQPTQGNQSAPVRN